MTGCDSTESMMLTLIDAPVVPAIADMRVQHPVDMLSEMERNSPYREIYTDGQMLGNTLCAMDPASLLYHPRFETTLSSGVKAYHYGGPPLVITSQATRPDQTRPCDQPHFLCMIAICIGHQIRIRLASLLCLLGSWLL